MFKAEWEVQSVNVLLPPPFHPFVGDCLLRMACLYCCIIMLSWQFQLGIVPGAESSLGFEH